jgi:DNA-binding MarR family transcriptional regulator
MIKKIPTEKEFKLAHDMLSSRTFPILIHLSDVLNRYIDTKFKDKIDWLRINALMVITIRGGTMNLTQLSGSMIRPKWTITKLIDAMEKDGLVARVRSKTDRRSTMVRTTKDGLETLEQFLLLCDQAEKETFNSLEKSDITTLELISRLLIGRLVELTSDHHDSFFHYHRGIFYKALGRNNAALANFKRSLETANDKSLIKQIKKEISGLESST